MRGIFRLDLQNLDAAGKTYSAAIPLGWLRGVLEDCNVTPAAGPGGATGQADSEDAEEARVEVRYSRSGTDLVVRGEVQAWLEAPCSRCLEPVRFLAEGELSLLLVPSDSPRAPFARGKVGASGGAAHDEYEFHPDEADLDTYDGDELLLDPFVREALLLEVPSFLLCSDTCQGIAPPPDVSATDGPSIDPRLAPLLKFVKKRDLAPRLRGKAVAVPKRRTTRSKSKMRRAQHDKVTAPNIAPCTNCGEPSISHRVCASCGFYKGANTSKEGSTT
jgi:uncharacterized protein